MADSNNNLIDALPAHPDAALKTLKPMLGTWSITGNLVKGIVRFEWLEGGYFLTQHVDISHEEQRIKGTEYIGFDEDTQTLRSHYMDNHGGNFTYTWELKEKNLRIWFGGKGSDNFFEGVFADDGASYAGKWQWPGGGYAATMTRVSS